MLESILPIATLLDPIPGDDPAGSDLRAATPGARAFQALKQARSSARTAERQIAMGGDESAGARPNWQPVLDTAARLLAEHSKDLEVAAYLVEALARLHGFGGLGVGFQVCRGLIENYWEGLYPRPDEEGLATRVAPLMILNGEGIEGTLIVPILNIPLTEPGSGGPFGCAHYLQAERAERAGDPAARKHRAAAGTAVLKEIREAVAESAPAFYARLASDLEGAISEFRTLTGWLDSLCGDLSPHSSNIRNALESCRDALFALAGDKLRKHPSAGGGGAAAAVEAACPDLHPAPAGGPAIPFAMDASPGVSSREQALYLLSEIADFFRRTEPHSPLPYALDQAVRWGRTPLPQLLDELIPEPAIKQHYFRLVGIPTS